MTEVTLTRAPAGGKSRMTPAGIQPVAMLSRRRALVALLNVVTIGLLVYGMAIAFSIGKNGVVLLDAVFLLCALVGVPWTVMGFWNAMIGLWLLHGKRDGLNAVAPYWAQAEDGSALNVRTAILMTLRNEDPQRAMARLKVVRDSLDETGQGAAFDFFVLSDTSKDGIAAEEERACDAWRAHYGPDARLTYRRRTANEGYKAGNVRDFLNRWGDAYEFFIPLDADSLMSGPFIVKLMRVAQAHPRLGILQTLVVGLPARSAFARLFQFGMRHGMRSYTMGSAWWTGDCGPFWGHNAIVRVRPFRDHCGLKMLPGKPPLGGHILSHDQVEAAYMRRAGYEVRVLPIEDGSYEDNPPTLLDFTQRDLRWCQGNMQYWQLLRERGLAPLSRFQIAAAIMMYFSAVAWVGVAVAAAAIAALGGFQAMDSGLAVTLFLVILSLSMAPKLAGLTDAALTAGGAARYGGRLRLAAGGLCEIAFSLCLFAITALRVTIFMTSLLFGRTITWSGQQRDARGLSWATAARGLWPQTFAGAALLCVFWFYAPGAILWGAPMLGGLVLSIPFAVLTASPAFGALLARARLCAVPEEFVIPPEIAALGPTGGQPVEDKSSDALSGGASGVPQPA